MTEKAKMIPSDCLHCFCWSGIVNHSSKDSLVFLRGAQELRNSGFPVVLITDS